MSLEQLFLAADSITDYRTEEERKEFQSQYSVAIAELGEVIGEGDIDDLYDWLDGELTDQEVAEQNA